MAHSTVLTVDLRAIACWFEDRSPDRHRYHIEDSKVRLEPLCAQVEPAQSLFSAEFLLEHGLSE